MTKKHISFTIGQGSKTSYIIELEEKDFTEKMNVLRKGEPRDIPLQDFGMYKLEDQNTNVIPVPDGEVVQLFGTTNGNKILEFMFKNSDIGSKVPA